MLEYPVSAGAHVLNTYMTGLSFRGSTVPRPFIYPSTCMIWSAFGSKYGSTGYLVSSSLMASKAF